MRHLWLWYFLILLNQRLIKSSKYQKTRDVFWQEAVYIEDLKRTADYFGERTDAPDIAILFPLSPYSKMNYPCRHLRLNYLLNKIFHFSVCRQKEIRINQNAYFYLKFTAWNENKHLMTLCRFLGHIHQTWLSQILELL